jgi:hypothetical protein
MTFTGNFTRLTARFASPAQQMQQGQRQLSTELSSSNHSLSQLAIISSNLFNKQKNKSSIDYEIY